MTLFVSMIFMKRDVGTYLTIKRSVEIMKSSAYLNGPIFAWIFILSFGINFNLVALPGPDKDL